MQLSGFGQAGERVAARLPPLLPGLMALADALHAAPELAFAEHRAAGLLAARLAQAGFTMESGIAGMPTAFRATLGSGTSRVILCAEYDALPGLGHACGHNLIAAISLGAALCLAPEIVRHGGRLEVLGTPGEECLDNGGKLRLFDAGYFDDASAVLMAHPAPLDAAAPALGAGGLWRYRFHGSGGHGFGHHGYRPAPVDDALMLAELATTLLARRLPPGSGIHLHRPASDGSINVRARAACLEAAVRAPDLRTVLALAEQVSACAEGAARATGLVCEILAPERPYAEFYPDPGLANAWRAALAVLGRRSRDDVPPLTITTDLGLASTLVPCLHPFIGLDSAGHANHEAGFADACRGAAAEACVRDGALALALTALGVLMPGASAMPSQTQAHTTIA
jgi:amidohydrolase